MKATPEDVAKPATIVVRHLVALASMKATPEDVAKDNVNMSNRTVRNGASMKATPEDVAKAMAALRHSPNWNAPQ